MTPAKFPTMASIIRDVMPDLDSEQTEALCRAGHRAKETAAEFRARVHRFEHQRRANLEKRGGSALCSKYDAEYRAGTGGWR